MDKYKYLTDQDLGYKPRADKKAKFEYSPLGEVLSNKTKSQTHKNKIVKKTNKTKICFITNSIVL